MKNADLLRAVARATGESITRLRRIGFHLVTDNESVDADRAACGGQQHRRNGRTAATLAGEPRHRELAS
jgi:hypothetical protein